MPPLQELTYIFKNETYKQQLFPLPKGVRGLYSSGVTIRLSAMVNTFSDPR